MESKEASEDFYSLSEAAVYANVTRQAIYIAIKKNRITANKISGKWHISREDLDRYRASKYNGDNRKVLGYRIFDLEKGHYSVHIVGKLISEQLGRHFPIQRIYYLLRTGQVKGFKKGAAWVVTKEDALKLLENELDKMDNMISM